MLEKRAIDTPVLRLFEFSNATNLRRFANKPKAIPEFSSEAAPKAATMLRPRKNPRQYTGEASKRSDD